MLYKTFVEIFIDEEVIPIFGSCRGKSNISLFHSIYRSFWENVVIGAPFASTCTPRVE